MLALLLAGALLDPQAPASAPTPPPPPTREEWHVVVAAPVYQPDGAMATETVGLGRTGPSVVHIFSRGSVCDTATAGAAEPGDATMGWRLAARTLQASAAEIVVSLDWRRVWDRGQRVTDGPGGTVQLTLHPGDRIALDHIPNPSPTDACRAVGVGLEVRLARRAVPVPPDSRLVPLAAVEGGVAALDADLWLVHKLPHGTEQAQHQRVRLAAQGGAFGFAPVSVTTARGDTLVEIVGSIRRYREPGGREYLFVSIARQLTGSPMPAGGVSGGTGAMIPLDPSEVISLEIPTAPRVAAGRGGFGGGGGAGGGRGGGIVAGGGASAGAGSSSGGGAGATTGAPRGSGGAQQGSGGAPRGSGGAGGAVGGMFGSGGRGGPATVTEAIRLLDGHGFSLRLRVTPVPGM
jgi:hypothetical protein